MRAYELMTGGFGEGRSAVREPLWQQRDLAPMSALSQSLGPMACGCAGCVSKIAYEATTSFSGELTWSLETGDDRANRQTPQGPQAVNEPSDVIPGATTTTYTLAIGGSDTGVVNTLGDSDWFRVELVAGQSYVFTLTPSGGAPLADTFLDLFNSAGQLIAVDDDGGVGPNSLMRFTATQSGTYYLGARAYENEGTGGYTVAANTGAPQNPLDTLDTGYRYPIESQGLEIFVYFSVQNDQFSGDTALRNWTDLEIATVMNVLGTISAVTPLVFTRTFSTGNSDFRLTIADLDPNVLGHFFIGAGNGAFAPDATGWNSAGMAAGSLGFATILHEILHGLGLAHPHLDGLDNQVMQGVISEFNSFGTFLMNQGVFTTMSYNDGWESPFGPTGTIGAGTQATPMALDIAYLQQLYGANTTTNSGNNLYTLSAADGAFLAIWDTGGIDTIQYLVSNQLAATIDLRPATLQNEIGGGGFVSFVAGFDAGFTIAAGVVIENAIGANGADTLIGNEAANTLTGNNGSDTLRGNGASDILQGGVGNDTLEGGAGDDQLNGGVGGDAIDGGDGFDTVRYDGATAGVIIYVDAPHANTGEAAGDTLTSIEGFVGSTFNDYMVGGVANNVLQGFGGVDILEGHGGDDLLDGGDGDDALQGGIGGDILDGGAGFDTARYDGAIAGVTIYVDAAYANTGEAAGDFHISIEGIVGSTFNDYLVGGVANNILQGFSGDDILEGHGGDDLLDGGDGADQMNGGTGGDIFDGGAGFDTVRYDGATSGVIAFMSDAWANTGEAAGDAYISIEALYGSNFDDTISGASNNNELQGFDGTDFIYGYGGSDFLGGGDGGDFLDGGAGTDQLQGGAGNDQFIFRAGESNGDAALDFAGNGAAAGDNLLFIGYGTAGQGATFTQLNATQWQITSADGLITDIITLTNGATADASDYGFGT